MRRLALQVLATVFVVALALGMSPLSRAGGPATHEIAGVKAFEKGELEALTLGDDGVLRVGPSFDAVELEAPTAWAATRSGSHVWIGTGNEGQILRLESGQDEIHRIDTNDGLMVTALAPTPDGGVIAAVFPGARLLEVTPDDEAPTTLATLPAEHVWDLLSDGRGGVIAATGMPGAIWAVDPFGAVSKLADVGDDHARCLARHDGQVWAGTAPAGLVLALEGQKVRVVRDLEAQEVVALASLGEEGVLVAANTDQAGGNAQKLTSLLKQVLTPPATKPGSKPQPRASLQDGHVLWIEPNGAVTTLWSAKKVAALALVRDGQGAVLGTYPSGRLVRVEPREPAVLVADLPQAEASVLLSDGTALGSVVTSNPVVLHRTRAKSSQGTWTSAPVDAGASSRWGRASVLGKGVASLAYRSGETKEPGDTWSDWQPAEAFDGISGGTGAYARFLQVRVTLEGAEAWLRRVSIVAQTPNRTPVIEELKVTRKEDKGKDGAIRATSLRKIAWKATDADGDRLQVNLHAQRGGSSRWIELVGGKVLAKPEWEWETSGLPDGAYRVRLVVSDSPDAPPDRTRDALRSTPPLLIDNTPPHVKVGARRAEDRLLVEGDALDQPGGRIVSVRVSVNGQPWVVTAARDGIFDEAAEAFEASLPWPGEGIHDVVVQARDVLDNVGAAATVVEGR